MTPEEELLPFVNTKALRPHPQGVRVFSFGRPQFGNFAAAQFRQHWTSTHTVAGSAFIVTATSCGRVFVLTRGHWIEVGALAAKNVGFVACGHKHCLALTRHGQVYQFDCPEPQPQPAILLRKLIPSSQRVQSVPCVAINQNDDALARHIQAGWDFSAILNADGRVLTWGNGEDGRLGHGNTAPLTQPTAVEALASSRIVDIACGWAHTLCINEIGEIFSWGANESGQLGLGHSKPQHFPQTVAFTEGPVIGVAAGGMFSVVWTRDQVFSCGHNRYGQLGLGSTQNQNKFSPITELQGTQITAVRCGSYHAVAIDSNHRVWVWGRADLGVPTKSTDLTTHTSTPQATSSASVSSSSLVAPALTRPTLVECAFPLVDVHCGWECVLLVCEETRAGKGEGEGRFASDEGPSTLLPEILFPEL